MATFSLVALEAQRASHSNLPPFSCPLFADGRRLQGQIIVPLIYLISLSSSTLVTDGQFSSPQHANCCGLLCSSVFSWCSFLSISPLVSRLRYEMAGTVAGDGAPRLLSVVRSSGVCWTRLFRSLTVSLLGSVPSRCRCFTVVALSSCVLWSFVVSCGTGWASTSIDNL